MLFTQIGKEAGDCTAPYSVTDYKALTVEDFITEVLTERPKEWGYISVDKPFYVTEETCEYRHGGCLYNRIPQEILAKRIKSVEASGGWSRMDYVINTK